MVVSGAGDIVTEGIFRPGMSWEIACGVNINSTAMSRLEDMTFRKSHRLNVELSLDRAAEGGRPYVSIVERRQRTFINHFCASTAWP